MSTQPKPTGEWTAARLREIVYKQPDISKWSEILAPVFNASLAAEREQSARNVSALAKAHQQQLAVEREKLEKLIKLLESDTSKGSALRNQPLINIIHSVITRKNQPHPMKLDFTKTYDLDDPEIQQLRDQLAAERKVLDMIRGRLAEGCTIKATDASKPILQRLPDGTWNGNLYISGKDELVTERELRQANYEDYVTTAQQLRHQLATAQAAIERHNKGGYCKLIVSDTTKPLVDALKDIASGVPDRKQMIEVADDALLRQRLVEVHQIALQLKQHYPSMKGIDELIKLSDQA